MRYPVLPALAALTLTGVATAQTYDVDVIGPIQPTPLHYVFALDLNDAGRVVGFEIIGDPYAYRAFLDDGQGRVPLALPAGVTMSEATAVNEQGVVAGVLTGPGGVNVYTWAAGVTTLLPSPPGVVGVPVVSGMSDAGVIVGSMKDGANHIPVAWVGGQPQTLASPAGTSEIAADVNELGQVLVTHSSVTGPTGVRIVDLATGVSTDLPNPQGSYLRGSAINDDGVVVGGRANRAFRWSAATGFETLVFPNAFTSEATDINAAGHVTGIVTNVQTGSRGVLWIGSEAIDLVPFVSSHHIYQAFDLNDDGAILATALLASNQDRFFLKLTPEAETTSYCAAVPNSTGSPALMDSAGSASVSLDTLDLTAATVPASTFGLFVFADQQAQTPFGAGFLCVALPFSRLPIEMADASGVLSHSLSLATGPATVIAAGTTWNFQAWFRDNPATPPFNTSDGLAVQFTL